MYHNKYGGCSDFKIQFFPIFFIAKKLLKNYLKNS